MASRAQKRSTEGRSEPVPAGGPPERRNRPSVLPEKRLSTSSRHSSASLASSSNGTAPDLAKSPGVPSAVESRILKRASAVVCAPETSKEMSSMIEKKSELALPSLEDNGECCDQLSDF